MKTKTSDVIRVGVVYTRVSDQESAERENGSNTQQARMGHDKATQLSAATGLRHEIKYTLTEEEGVSGGHTNRPQYQRMIQLIKRKQIDFIISKEISRLNRSLSDFLGLVELCSSCGVSIHLKDLDLDPNSPMSGLLFKLLALIAEFERKLIIDRTRSSIRTARKHDSKINGGPLILGFDRNPERPGHWTINEAEISQVIMLMQHFTASASYKATLTEAHRLGIKGKNNQMISKSGLRRMLENKRYIGLLRLPSDDPNDDSYVEMSCGPAVPKELFSKVQDTIANIGNDYSRVNRQDGRTYLLTGLIFYENRIPLTGNSGTSRQGTKHYYYYDKTSGIRLNADAIEAAVLRSLRIFENDQKMTAYAATLMQSRFSRLDFLESQLRECKRELTKVDQEESSLNSQLKVSDLTSERVAQWLDKKLTELEEKRDKLQLTHRELELEIQTVRNDEIDSKFLSKSLRQVFDRLDNADPKVQRGILRQLIKKVNVYERNQVEVVWDAVFE